MPNVKDGDGIERAARGRCAERERVASIIRRDQIDRQREIDRKAAELDVGNGKTVSISEAVIEPTPEWLDKGDVATFTPKLERGTVKTVKAYRRVSTPIIARMYSAGKITEDQFQACAWYRTMYETSGLLGRVKSNHISLTGNTGGSSTFHSQSPWALHEREAEARFAFRDARSAITAFYLKFFEAVVLNDIPVSRSWRFAKCPKHKAEARLRQVAQELADFCSSSRVEFEKSDQV